MKHGKLDKKEIERLKALHGSLYEISVKDEDDITHFAYAKKPNLETISVCAKYAESDPVKSGITMYNTVVVSKSEYIDNNDELKLSVVGKLGNLFKIREAEIKKL